VGQKRGNRLVNGKSLGDSPQIEFDPRTGKMDRASGRLQVDVSIADEGQGGL